MLDLLGGRKAAACLLAVLVAVVATVMKGDIPAGLSDLLKWVVTAYVAGNVGSDVVAAVVTPKPPGSQPVTDAVVADQGGSMEEATKAAALPSTGDSGAIPMPSAATPSVDLSPITADLSAIKVALGQVQTATSLILQIATGQRPQ